MESVGNPASGSLNGEPKWAYYIASSMPPYNQTSFNYLIISNFLDSTASVNSVPGSIIRVESSISAFKPNPVRIASNRSKGVMSASAFIARKTINHSISANHVLNAVPYFRKMGNVYTS